MVFAFVFRFLLKIGPRPVVATDTTAAALCSLLGFLGVRKWRKVKGMPQSQLPFIVRKRERGKKIHVSESVTIYAQDIISKLTNCRQFAACFDLWPNTEKMKR